MADGRGDRGIGVAVLGPPRVERDGRQLSFDTRKAIALLAHLAFSEHPQRRDSLALLLWPDADQVHARSALRRTLSVLKQGLGDGRVLATREEIALVSGPGLTVDVRDFLAGIASDDLRDVAAAARLWRGDLLEGFSVRDSPAFDDWQRNEGERLRRMFGAALARLVEGLAGAGRLDEAIDGAARWLRLDSLHEPAHRALMRLHAQRGDRAAAVRQYRDCVRIVDEELGVLPLDETTALYEWIAAGAVVVTTAASMPAARPPAQPGRGLYPLVGRAVELPRLATAVRPGAVIVVTGEPGVGKTRLVDEVLAGRSDDAITLTVRCYDSHRDVPYAPIVDLLRIAAAHPEAAARLAALPSHSLAEAARLVPELAVAGIEPARDGPGAEARFLDGVARAVASAASGAEAGVIVVDDAQWADHASQQVMAHLIRRTDPEGPSLIFTLRTGEVGDASPLAHALSERMRRTDEAAIQLERLDRDAVAELVAQGDVDAGSVAELAEKVHRETEGLPFFVVAYLDALAGGGSMPADVGDLLRSRLASLSGGATQLLATASVVGHSFSFDVIRAASGRSEDETVAALDELLARGLVDERDTADGPAYDFAHAQVRRFVYEHASLARRRLLHRRVAAALQTTSHRSADPDAVAAVIAHHERLAGRDDIAALYFSRAGDHARAIYANADALGHYEAALALGHPDIAVLHEAIGDLQTFDGRFTDAVASYERAAARCGQGEVARLEAKLGGVHQRRGEWPSAEQHYDAALAALGAGGPPSVRSGVLADWAITAHRQGHAERAGELAAAAFLLADREGDDDARTQAGIVAGILAASRGEIEVARDLLARSLDLAERAGDPAARVAAANALAQVERTAGDLPRAEALLVGALAVAVSIGDRHRQAALHDHLALVLHEAGRDDDAMRHLKLAVMIFSDIGAEGGSVQTEVWRLSEWVDPAVGSRRNDPGTVERDNLPVAPDVPSRLRP